MKTRTGGILDDLRERRLESVLGKTGLQRSKPRGGAGNDPSPLPNAAVGSTSRSTNCPLIAMNHAGCMTCRNALEKLGPMCGKRDGPRHLTSTR